MNWARLVEVFEGRHGFAFVLALTACRPGLPSTGSSSETSSSSSTTSSSMTSTTSEGSSQSETESEVGTETSGFVPPSPDLPEACDVFAQDCAEGEKCVPWVDPEGSYWIGFTCVPVLGQQAIGEPCTFDYADSSDDCDANGSCYNLDLFQGVSSGTCHAFCTGSEDDPMCSGSDYCVIGNGYPGPALCFEQCDPLAQDCPGERGCYWFEPHFSCFAAGEIAAGDPCEFLGQCEPGNMCLVGWLLSTCEGGYCCTPVCPVSGGPGPCVGVQPGTECVPFYDQGMAPQGYEDVGVCMVDI